MEGSAQLHELTAQCRPRLPDLGRKLDHLLGIMGAYLPHDVSVDRFQARCCNTTFATFSRKRVGLAPVNTYELGALAALFQLGPELDYRLFYLDFEAFDQALRAARKGCYGPSPIERNRSVLRAAADPERRITIELLRPRHVGGIGGDLSSIDPPTFRVGDRVRLHVPLDPKGRDGHLYVFNDLPSRDEMACLMPSPYAPDTRVRGTSVRLPLEDVGPSSFPVSGPTDVLRRLYALWSDSPLGRFLPLEKLSRQELSTLSGVDLNPVASLLQDENLAGDKKPLVRAADYYVS